MKQRITVNELKLLSENNKMLIKEWWTPQQGDVCVDLNYGTIVLNYVDSENIAELRRDGRIPLLSIGQMIEYLENPTMEYDGDWVITDGHRGNTAFDKELCDALFKLLKQILELE